MIDERCEHCGADDFHEITTYKRIWMCCRKCGTSVCKQRKAYPFAFLPFSDFQKSSALSEENMYDYFVDRVHIEWSEAEGKQFIQDFVRPYGIAIEGKKLLDISGGNGHFIKQIEKLGCSVTLTEINKKTIEYARQTHGFEVFEYNINDHDLSQLTHQQFDIVFARACVMFAKDMGNFAEQLHRCVAANGTLVIHRSVIPTLGVMLRTQLDEFSYLVLREPDVIIEVFAKHGFRLVRAISETDPSLYVYDHDLLARWRWLYRFYESRAIRKLQSDRRFAWPARDRRLAHLIFQKTE